ncbi:hypothetical protein [Tsukamurella spumae]|uniref:Uncharacterized protein n=1 Tax=Tsukamurella spumae TaxID=44753 RepID=A0A846WZV8_9ACTN|nr:hypothetical protein [Tsukamurella spumae]NKY17619.1 hypothetical protein [Tsukamurella spumae]
MLPWNRRRYRLPNPAAGLALTYARAPFIVAVEILRRCSPTVDAEWQASSMRSWERWLDWAAREQGQDFHVSANLREESAAH